MCGKYVLSLCIKPETTTTDFPTKHFHLHPFIHIKIAGRFFCLFHTVDVMCNYGSGYARISIHFNRMLWSEYSVAKQPIRVNATASLTIATQSISIESSQFSFHPKICTAHGGGGGVGGGGLNKKHTFSPPYFRVHTHRTYTHTISTASIYCYCFCNANFVIFTLRSIPISFSPSGFVP